MFLNNKLDIQLDRFHCKWHILVHIGLNKQFCYLSKKNLWRIMHSLNHWNKLHNYRNTLYKYFYLQLDWHNIQQYIQHIQKYHWICMIYKLMHMAYISFEHFCKCNHHYKYNIHLQKINKLNRILLDIKHILILEWRILEDKQYMNHPNHTQDN